MQKCQFPIELNDVWRSGRSTYNYIKSFILGPCEGLSIFGQQKVFQRSARVSLMVWGGLRACLLSDQPSAQGRHRVYHLKWLKCLNCTSLLCECVWNTLDLGISNLLLERSSEWRDVTKKGLLQKKGEAFDVTSLGECGICGTTESWGQWSRILTVRFSSQCFHQIQSKSVGQRWWFSNLFHLEICPSEVDIEVPWCSSPIHALTKLLVHVLHVSQSSSWTFKGIRFWRFIMILDRRSQNIIEHRTS